MPAPKGHKPGPPPEFTTDLVDIYARVYYRVQPQLCRYVGQKMVENPKFNVTQPIIADVKKFYDDAFMFYTAPNSPDASHGFISAKDLLFSSKESTNIRNIIMLQRFAMSIEVVQGSALKLTSSMVADKVTLNKFIAPKDRISGTEYENCRNACKFIGMGWAVGKPRALTGHIGNTGMHFSLDPTNPFASALVRPNISIIKEMRKTESGDAAAKRATGLPGMALGAAAIYLAIIALIESMGDGNIDAPQYAHKSKQLYRKCQVLLFVVMSMTSPARGRETLMATWDDLTERVEGDKEFMIICRCMLKDPDSLPRTKFYSYRRLHAKHVNQLVKYMQQVLPEYASALSVPDVMNFCLTIMIRLQHEKLLSPRHNPHMHIFMGTGDGKDDEEAAADDEQDQADMNAQRAFDEEVDMACAGDAEVIAARAELSTSTKLSQKRKSTPFGEGDLEMARMDAQLKQDVPPCCVRKLFISGYSCRTGLAIILEKLDIMSENNDKTLTDFVRLWYGHSEKSWQVLAYAETTARFRMCQDCAADNVDSKKCWCSRLRPPTAKKVRV